MIGGPNLRYVGVGPPLAQFLVLGSPYFYLTVELLFLVYISWIIQHSYIWFFALRAPDGDGGCYPLLLVGEPKPRLDYSNRGAMTAATTMTLAVEAGAMTVAMAMKTVAAVAMSEVVRLG